MQGNYTIGTTRTLTILNDLGNPVDGYHVSFTWVDDAGHVRQSMIKVERAGATKDVVNALILEEIGRVESWMS